MPRKLFPLERKPLFTAISSEDSVAGLVRQARNALYAGADALCVELKNLPQEERTAERLRPLMEATPLPVMCCLYRNDTLKKDDDARQVDLLAALDAGAACIDVPGDLFDKSPREWTRTPRAIATQKRLLSKIHRAGGQVIMSSHIMMTEAHAYLPPEEVLAQLSDFASRGADIVKLVQTADTDEEFLGALRATMLCNRELKTPFVHLVAGRFATLHRNVAPALGIALTFCVVDYNTPFAMPQPQVGAMKSVYSNLHFHIDQVGGQ